MARRAKLTNNSDESDIAGVLSGDSIFSIPYFQRPYKWKSERLRRLQEDVLNVVDSLDDEAPDTHFLGAIIIHGRRRKPSEPTVFEVIDGQQRLTTIFLTLAAIVRVFCKLEQYDEAVGLFQRYLTLGRQTGMLSNVKLHPGKEDRNQLNLMMSDLMRDGVFREKLGAFTPVSLPATGPQKGALINNYKATVRFLEGQHKQAGVDRVRQIVHALLDYMSVVQIDVFDPTNGPKIFDSLNSRQEPMTVGDLIRNEVFSRVSDQSPEEVERLDRDRWRPFYDKFRQKDRNLFDSYFFPYGLIRNPNLSKSEIYGHLREQWKDLDSPGEIIDQLARYQNAFIDILVGTNLQKHEPALREAISHFYEMDTPSATYPFLMQVSQNVKEGIVDEKRACLMLRIVESFLVRRAISGIEPTGLHSVFKRLWNELNGDYADKKIIAEIRKHNTVKWPSEQDFESDVKNRPLYGSAITNFFIKQYDRSLGGDLPQNIPWLEHILPVEPDLLPLNAPDFG